MAMLTVDRNTPSKTQTIRTSERVAAGAVIYNGAMVTKNAAGFAVPAEDVVGSAWRDVVGVAEESADNSLGADGAVRVKCQKGVYGMINDGTITQADESNWVYVIDDQTVGRTSANSIYAGVLLDWRDQDDGLCYILLY